MRCGGKGRLPAIGHINIRADSAQNALQVGARLYFLAFWVHAVVELPVELSNVIQTCLHLVKNEL
jgi:hypothetical protein